MLCCDVGRSDSAALRGSQWSRPGDGSAAGARSSSHRQDEERTVAPTHECPGRPRRLCTHSALSSRRYRRRHHRMSFHRIITSSSYHIIS